MADSKPTLYDRLGGPETVQAVVDEFYQRVLADEKLAPFFRNTKVTLLKVHQTRFLKIAFTGIPEDMDVGAYMQEKHARLFEEGLNAEHFDLVAGHLVATLHHFNVAPGLINEAGSIVVSLRPAFEEGAEIYGKKGEVNKQGVGVDVGPYK